MKAQLSVGLALFLVVALASGCVLYRTREFQLTSELPTYENWKIDPDVYAFMDSWGADPDSHEFSVSVSLSTYHGSPNEDGGYLPSEYEAHIESLELLAHQKGPLVSINLGELERSDSSRGLSWHSLRAKYAVHIPPEVRQVTLVVTVQFTRKGVKQPTTERFEVQMKRHESTYPFVPLV